MALPEGLTFWPSIGLQATHTDQDGYTERDAGALNLIVPENRNDSLKLSLGMGASASHDLSGDRTFSPEIRARYIREMIDDAESVPMKYAGSQASAFITKGGQAPRGTFRMGLGGTYETGGAFSFFGQYDAEFNDDLQGHELKLGTRFIW